MPDPYERAAEPPAPPPEERRLRSNVPLQVALGLFLLFVFVRIGGGSPPSAPDLAPDCTTPAFRLSSTTAKAGSVLAYTIVGPADRRYALGVDGGSLGQAAVATTPQQPRGCQATGRLGLSFLGAGKHTVTLFELSPDADRAVASVEVTVH